MFCFDINCPLAGVIAEIRFTGEPAPRGHAAFRGFTCEHEADCERAGIACSLYDAAGAQPFHPGDALRHLNG